MHNPIGTYRIQFHEGFTFDDFERIIPFLQKLGVSTIYASPVFQSVPGSMHGYDGVNPHRINPGIGTEAQLRAISKKLHEYGIGWLQDIVPNHMAFHPGNSWLMDVLEKGQHSWYAGFFDIDWNSPVYNGRVMVPVLSTSLEEVISKGELKIEYKDGRLLLCYSDSCYPINPHSYAAVLHAGIAALHEPLRDLMGRLPAQQLTNDNTEFYLRWDAFLNELSSLMKEDVDREFIETGLQKINKDPDRLLQIAEDQYYRLCHWQETDKQINYRRFFTVNGLICLNIQDPKVFDHYHSFISSLVTDGIFPGLRIDHIDGLYDPTVYLERLRELAGEETYIVVEKILEPGERLQEQWPIQGSTGYDFLSLINNLFTNERSEKIFTKFYRDLAGKDAPVQQQVQEKKAYILYEHMSGELENLYRLFLKLNLAGSNELSWLPQDNLKNAIGALLIQCPVYRYYGNQLPLSKEESVALQNIFNRIRKSHAALIPGIEVLENSLLKIPEQGDEEFNKRALHFYKRCMQFTGPLMAKGVEDTLMYAYTSFIGHNEVGDAPETIDLNREDFHRSMLDRQVHWPLSMNTTSTHDTKRGEDARARLNVLTDLPDEWLAAVNEWQTLNANLKINGAPDSSDEYFIYQTLIATYPLTEETDYGDRLQEYLTKALREAKTHSNWTEPNEEYEEGVKNFAAALLDTSLPFWRSFSQIHKKVAGFGIINSLAQVLLKFTCPGIPDTYQGTELWDLSLVDPDNRRPVDYLQRQQWLDSLGNGEKDNSRELLKELWQHRHDARIKLWLIQQLFVLRKDSPELYSKGHYIPLRVAGKYKDCIFAFARRYREQWLLIAVPLNAAPIINQEEEDILSFDWEDTKIILRDEAPKNWEHLLLHASGKESDGIAIKEIFTELPFALLRLQEPVSERGAGILMAVSSLPSAFGVGDLGPEAKAFAQFLSRSKQKYWQLLPLNPTDGGNGHSPYSSISGLAGNTLLISPELLAEAGFLDRESLKKYYLPVKEKVDYEEARLRKEELFETAWQCFCNHASKSSHDAFEKFCGKENYWLNDYALFVLLKQQQNGIAWYQWPAPFKNRDKETLDLFAIHHKLSLDKIKWLQFIFWKQWRDLKDYCNSLSIAMFGDMPFYASHDSVEVWSHPDIFSLDNEGRVTGMAGVPPDYFSADGQLWGMPTFCWDVLKDQHYEWWVQRIRKNLELFDLLRLDHFRAFQDYWEVPAGEETARNGRWLPGPRHEIFKVFEKELGSIPFVAEDLGYEMEAVYTFRDTLNLPGMKVLQFAFGENLHTSVDAPHNYTSTNCIVYPGTHDNNTTRGWFRQEAGEEGHGNLERYVGHPVTEDTINTVFGAMAYASIARVVILPIQDILDLDEHSRMNTPGSGEGNWLWRLQPGQITAEVEKRLRDWVKIYDRT